MHIMETYPNRTRPAMRGTWANPATGLVKLDDVVAARPSIEGLPLSCTEAASSKFQPSPRRPAADPEDLLPEVMMAQAETELMVHFADSQSVSVGSDLR